MHVPEIYNKHTHTQTIIRHHFYPKKKVVEHHHHHTTHKKSKSSYHNSKRSRVDPPLASFTSDEELPELHEITSPPRYEVKKLKPNYEVVIKSNEKKHPKLYEDYNRNKPLKVVMVDDIPLNDYKITGFGKGYDYKDDDEEIDGSHAKFRFTKPISSLHTSFEGPGEYIKLSEKDHITYPSKYTSNKFTSKWSPKWEVSNSKKHNYENDESLEGFNAWPISLPSQLKEYSTISKSLETDGLDDDINIDTSYLDQKDIESKSFMDQIKKYITQTRKKYKTQTPPPIVQKIIEKHSHHL